MILNEYLKAKNVYKCNLFGTDFHSISRTVQVCFYSIYYKYFKGYASSLECEAFN